MTPPPAQHDGASFTGTTIVSPIAMGNDFTLVKALPTSPVRLQSNATMIDDALAQAVNRTSSEASRSLPTASPSHMGSTTASTTTAILDDADLRLLWGKATPFKEGDAAIALASTTAEERAEARSRLARVRLGSVHGDRFIDDEVTRLLEQDLDHELAARIAQWTMDQLRCYLLAETTSEADIKALMPGLRSEVLAGVSKLMADDELVRVAAKVYNNRPGETLGARGHFSSRIQPNSPTDDPEEVLFSVLEGLSYGCGDTVFGINIVASDFKNVRRLEETLKDVVDTFELGRATKWCVLAHIDDQMAVAGRVQVHVFFIVLLTSTDDSRTAFTVCLITADYPALVDCAFQSIGGNEAINRVFNVDITKLTRHLAKVTAQYFETGQGSAVTNQAACGVDMNTLEARAHGIARAFQRRTGNWTIVNTVAGFIG